MDCLKKGTVKTGLGVLSGVGIGILLAPRSGCELRNVIKSKMIAVIDKVKLLRENDVELEMARMIKLLERDIKKLEKEKEFNQIEKQAKLIKTKSIDIVDLANETKDKRMKKLAKDTKKRAIEKTEMALKNFKD